MTQTSPVSEPGTGPTTRYGLNIPDEGRTYCHVNVGDVVACLTVHGAHVADFEGLVWSGGRVLFEFTGTVHLRGRPLELALEEALRTRLREECRRKASG
jgi:hypothetical protein